jgi:quercetin dioxygenase-like cupin family protein
MTVIKAAKVEWLGRGGGVETIPLITRKAAEEENKITTGISIYPVGTGAPLHSHNCDEHVTLLAGKAEVEIDGVVTPLSLTTPPT